MIVMCFLFGHYIYIYYISKTVIKRVKKTLLELVSSFVRIGSNGMFQQIQNSDSVIWLLYY